MKRNWVGALWTLWVLSFIWLAWLWWLGLSGSVDSALRGRQVAVLEGSPQLRESFTTLQQLGGLMLRVSVQEAADGLSKERLDELKVQGAPYYQCYYLASSGDPVFSSEPRAPDWLFALLQGLTDLERAVFRPLPPGFQMLPPDSIVPPDNFLGFGQKLPDGRYMAWVLEWDYVFDSWLNKQLKRFGLGDALQAELVPRTDVQPEAPNPNDEVSPLTLGRLDGSGFQWTWKVETFLADEPHMLDTLLLRVDNSQSVRQHVKSHLSFLAAGLILMGGFAFVLQLTSRAIRTEAEYSEARNRFVSQVSHELRTPITALEMYLEILSDGLVDDGEKIREYHQILRQESHRLKSLVENLLTVGLVESGNWRPQKQPVNIYDIVDRMSTTENREKREVRVEIEDRALTVQADREALYAVISNLFHNAVKYSPGDQPIDIRVRVEESTLIIDVKDRGDGLAVSDYAEVFRPYFRAEQTSKNKPGVGLGLALVQQIVQAHGGQVSGSPRDGGGSVFTVKLPIDG